MEDVRGRAMLTLLGLEKKENTNTNDNHGVGRATRHSPARWVRRCWKLVKLAPSPGARSCANLLMTARSHWSGQWARPHLSCFGAFVRGGSLKGQAIGFCKSDQDLTSTRGQMVGGGG